MIDKHSKKEYDRYLQIKTGFYLLHTERSHTMTDPLNPQELTTLKDKILTRNEQFIVKETADLRPADRERICREFLRPESFVKFAKQECKKLQEQMTSLSE